MLACALDRAAWVPAEKGCTVGRVPSSAASAGTGDVLFSRTRSSAAWIPCSSCVGVCREEHAEQVKPVWKYLHNSTYMLFFARRIWHRQIADL